MLLPLALGIAATTTALLVALSPGVAAAQSDASAASISDTTIEIGQSFTTHSGQGACPPGGEISYWYFVSQPEPFAIRKTVADTAGSSSFTYAFPEEVNRGPGVVEIHCSTSAPTAEPRRVRFTVVEDDGTDDSRTGADDELPYTGTREALMSGAAGIALIGLGLGTVALGRRRRS